MKDHRVDLAVLILCTDFANTVIWESWRSDDDNQAAEQRIGFVTHPRPENGRFIPYAVEVPITTQWGDSSLVTAELVMLAEALQRFPNARQFLIVSGDTVPIRTKEEFFDYFLDDDEKKQDVSIMTSSSDVSPVGTKNATALSRLGYTTMYMGHQFFALSKKHAKFLVSPVGRKAVMEIATIQYHAPGFSDNFSPDEVYLQTVLRNEYPVSEFFNHRFVEFLQEGRHAKVLTVDEFKKLYHRCLKSDTLFCIRKVSRQTQWDVFKVLGEYGVVNYASGTSVEPSWLNG
jgi:hypothetical protein